MRVIVKRPDERVGHFAEIPNTLKALQNIVDGPIECVRVDRNIVIICNEEGLLRHLPINHTSFHPFVGTIIFAGINGEEFADFPGTMDYYKRTCLIEV